MSVRRWPLAALVALCVAMGFRVAALWPQLPAVVAVHFDAAGRPNGWAGRNGLLLALAMPAIVMAAASIAVRWIDRLPDKRINLPNKTYWLGEPRRAETIDFIVAWVRWFLVLSLGMVFGVIVTALEANLSANPRLELPVWLLAAFGVSVVLMLAVLFLRFRRPRQG